MSIEYRLTLSGRIPLEEIAELVAPGTTEESTPSGKRILTADLSDEYGYTVSIVGGSNGYYDADDDGSLWVWEPQSYVDINFHMRKEGLTEKGFPNVLRAVVGVLNRRAEDAALVLNGNWLLVTRIGGMLRKHNLAEWYQEEYDEILPG